MKCPRCQFQLPDHTHYCGACGFNPTQPLPPQIKIFGSIVTVLSSFAWVLLGIFVVLNENYPGSRYWVILVVLVLILIMSCWDAFSPDWTYDLYGIVSRSTARLPRAVGWDQVEKISYWGISLNPRFFIKAKKRLFVLPVFQTSNSSKAISDIVGYVIQKNPQVIIDDGTLKKAGRDK